MAASKQDTTLGFLGGEFDVAITVVCLLLFIGAMGKSAQLGLHTWLPDAMEGPTPVSALIYAATMVTAGAFLVARMSPLMSILETTMAVVTVIGAATAFFAATIGMTQTDIKRVIAYSTCSQLGYMFFALGVSAYSAAIFHLMTHAFFKARRCSLALVWRSTPCRTSKTCGEMGGIYKKIPFTYAMMWIGSLALAGLPFFAGFYSKDIILVPLTRVCNSTLAGLGLVSIAAALMTAFYSWRLLIMTFHGPPRASAEVMSHVHESPSVMTVPLFILAIGAVFAGWLGYNTFVGSDMDAFWGASLLVLEGHNTVEAAHHVPLWVKLAPIVVGVVGIALAYVIYMLRPGSADRIASAVQPVYSFLFNKCGISTSSTTAVRAAGPAPGALFLENRRDGDIIDGYGPDGVSAAAKFLAGRASAVQSGFVYHYAFAMLIGMVVILSRSDFFFCFVLERLL